MKVRDILILSFACYEKSLRKNSILILISSESFESMIKGTITKSWP